MRRIRRASLFLSVLALVGAAVVPVSAANGDEGAKLAKFATGGQFVVQLADMPVVAYEGNIKGLKATKPTPGTKIDPDSADVVKYVGFLKNKHDAALKSVGAGANKKVYDYAYTFNGFSAKLSASEANRLAADPSVLAVTRAELVNIDTSSTPSFLGLDAPGGLWSQLGGTSGTQTAISGAGDGIVIGIVDSGIWAESPSFSDRDADGKLVYKQLNPNDFHGKCDSEENTIDETWDANLCNKKLVGARHYNASWGGDAALEAERPWEFMSPRDYNGHGTHTASTSGGNFGVPTTGPSTFFGDSISGMAPRARISAYKALWSTQSGDTASGLSPDLVAALDQAVADGVDVINYSISGSSTNFADPVQISMLFAADAGIFVAASAGNSGPTASTVAHPGPWMTTVAAGTHNRNGFATLTLGNAATYAGASAADQSVGPLPFIDSEDAGLPGADPNEVRLCFADTDNGGVPVLDPAIVANKIVLCDRGTNARTAKSVAVLEAGGKGMVLVNPTPNSINADLHFVPSIHLQDTDRAAVKAYANTAGATATIGAATLTFTDPAPFTATFSSRGPLTAGGGDLLKPDVIAPGQDILASVSPTPPNQGLSINLYSGTSMSSPHVAGLAALLKDAHPTWSPMAIKSALMTTGYDVLDTGLNDATRAFRQGAGHVVPNSATNPGLVYDSSFNDWLAFLCGTTTAVGPGTCAALTGLGYSTDPSDMNVASISIGDLPGTQTVTRKVRNVGAAAATYTAAVTGLPGVTAVVSPPNLTLNPGQTGTFTVTFTRTTAALNAFVGGQLTWTDGSHVVRSPLIVRPVAIRVPATQTVTAGADNGSTSWTVKVGYNGTLRADARGAAPDVKTLGEVVNQDPDQDPETDTFTSGVKFYDFSLSGAAYWAGGTMAATTEAGSDLDVYLMRDVNNDSTFAFPGELVALAADGDSEEIVQLIRPANGNYRLLVHGWGTPDGASTFDLHTWSVGGAFDGGSIESHAGAGDPVAVSVGDTPTITMNWTGLTAVGTQYRGTVEYFNGANAPANRIGTTVVLINR